MVLFNEFVPPDLKRERMCQSQASDSLTNYAGDGAYLTYCRKA